MPRTGKGGRSPKRKPKAKARSRVLADHRREASTFVAPLMAAVGDGFRSVSRMEDTLPELLWIALLIDRLGVRRGTVVAREFARGIRPLLGEGPRTLVVLSEYGGLGEDVWCQLVPAMPVDVLDDLRRSLWPLVGLYPDCPLSPLFDERWRTANRCDPDSEISYLKRVMDNLVDKTSHASTMLHATAVYVWALHGNLRFTQDAHPGDLDQLIRDPSSDLSKKIAASLRAMISSLKEIGAASGRAWAEYFGLQSLRISACDVPAAGTPCGKMPDFDRLLTLAAELERSLAEELDNVWARNLEAICRSGSVKAEVLTGLLSRQASLTCALVSHPLMWVPHVSFVLLRCMAETRIGIEWLARFGSSGDFGKFVEYGLGQDKLLAEHLKAAPDADSPANAELIQRFEQDISSERYPQLLNVDVGDWWPKSVRAMADDCDYGPVFALKYQPFGSYVHGTWNVLPKYNLVRCHNSLHAFHYVPVFGQTALHPRVAESAAVLMRESFHAWAAGLELREQPLRSVDAYLAEIQALKDT